MTVAQVIKLLRENQDPRGIAHWKKKPRELESFGIGLTRLRKFSKQIGRDHELAQQLWKSEFYDARVIGLLIDDPKQLTREQVEQQVEELHGGQFAHVFASCDATLAKAPFAFDVARDWMDSEDQMRRRCAYTLFYELSKKNPKGMDDAFLLARIAHIQDTILCEEMWVREGMAGALLGIGKRNSVLNAAAVAAATAIGPLEIDYGNDNSCEPIDLLKHLTSDYLKKKLNL
jgi:3-methyladenine DNA glycosylase AlkD